MKEKKSCLHVELAGNCCSAEMAGTTLVAGLCEVAGADLYHVARSDSLHHCCFVSKER